MKGRDCIMRCTVTVRSDAKTIDHLESEVNRAIYSGNSLYVTEFYDDLKVPLPRRLFYLPCNHLIVLDFILLKKPSQVEAAEYADKIRLHLMNLSDYDIIMNYKRVDAETLDLQCSVCLDVTKSFSALSFFAPKSTAVTFETSFIDEPQAYELQLFADSRRINYAYNLFGKFCKMKGFAPLTLLYTVFTPQYPLESARGLFVWYFKRSDGLLFLRGNFTQEQISEIMTEISQNTKTLYRFAIVPVNCMCPKEDNRPQHNPDPRLSALPVDAFLL